MTSRPPKILFIIGAVKPLNSTNANLMLKIIQHLSQKCEIHILSVGAYDNSTCTIDAYPELNVALMKYSTTLHICYPSVFYTPSSVSKRIVYRAISRIIDHGGYEDAYDGFILRDIICSLDAKHHFQAIFSCMEPYKAAYALSLIKTNAKKILYIIDPPAEVVPGLETACTPFRKSTSKFIIKQSDAIITTSRILRALQICAFDLSSKNILAEEFPLFAPLTYHPNIPSISFDKTKINLLYCGWLRNEDFLLQLVQHMDNRFSLTFVGNDNGRVKNLHTDVSIVTHTSVEHNIAVNAILDADILVCIGNTYPVHIPSKIFEYIASGKPIINLYHFPECPTLEHTKRYPLALNISTSMSVEEAAAQVMAFCLKNGGKRVPDSTLAEIYQSIASESIIENICTKIIDEVST